MGQEITFLQMLVLRDFYQIEGGMEDAVAAIGSFTVNVFAPLWFQAFFPSDSAPLLLEFKKNVEKFYK